MVNPFTEDSLVEASLISLLKGLWNDDDCHINAYSVEGNALLERSSDREVVLKNRLSLALIRINPGIPQQAIGNAIEEICSERPPVSINQTNYEMYKYLVDGIKVTVPNDDGVNQDFTVKIIDFVNVVNNDFLCVSQMWISGDLYRRRPDVIIFVNGIPLIVVELKASHRKVVEAFNENIKDYKDTIPKLFYYNVGVILSNGIESKFGSFSSQYEFFNEWKKAESESEEASTQLKTIVYGICDKARLLDIVENFVLHDTTGSSVKKIVPRYFQYHGVNAAFENVKRKTELNGKLGVFWHTQGSGKSFSMVYLSQKVLRKMEGNFTFIIVTDRKDLDRQSYKNFASVGAVYESEVHADSITHLKELLNADHRQIFTTIQKFQDIQGVISNRDDIIIMTDEAHRSQYDSFAMNMRQALPNSSFIGFTGTPLMADGEEKTRETFGEYISEYNFADSVRDGATVPLYYENRIPKLKNENSDLENDLSKVMDFYELNDQDEEKLERTFSSFYHLVTRDERLDVVAKDIVEHFVAKNDTGKAMVVSIDKKTAIRTYIKVKKYMAEYLETVSSQISSATDEFTKARLEKKYEEFSQLDMAVMVSQSQNEIADLEQYDIDVKPIRQRIINEDLEEQFKDADSDLRIIFVCAMWMTGFDVPNLSTLYLDKPMKNHTLMQAIARANRVYPNKQNGLIVDYIGVFRNIEKALAIYATNNKREAIIENKDVLIEKFNEARTSIIALLNQVDVDLNSIILVDPELKLIEIEKAVNQIIAIESIKKDFLELSGQFLRTFKSVLPDPIVFKYQNEANAIKVLSTRIRSISDGDVDLSAVKRDLEELLDRSIKASEFKIPAYVKLKDLSSLDAEKLKDLFAKNSNKIVQAEEIKSEIESKIKEMIARNKSRERFLVRLTKILDEYNQGSVGIDELLNSLVGLARELSDEDSRAVRENLTEFELALFDLIRKDELDENEIEQVKVTSRELLNSLKDKLVSGWREFDPLRSGVKTAITNVIYPKLPESKYSEVECALLSAEVYQFVYERYPDASALIAN
ncbi:COG0610 Type I site-specific restriction-modification system, R (restriction) subunit and related helicases [Candidatus Nanopelagicaceae bacterium]